MGNFRPLCDLWLLARPKVKFHGAYPSGFLERARALLGVGLDEAVLHVCAGKVRDYPFRGFGVNDKTVDLDHACAPDFMMDVRNGLPLALRGWPAVLIDRPYTPEDADQYVPGRECLPDLNALLAEALRVVRIGGKVGVLDYLLPRPPKTARFVACVGVIVGFNNRIRCYSVFERMP